MSAARARKVLLAAVAASLLLHLVFAGYFHWPSFDRTNASQVFKVREIRIARVAHTPPPTPRPPPVSTPAVRASIAPPLVQTHGGKGPPAPRKIASGPPATQPPPPTATPAPLATRQGACAFANADPTIAATPGVADIPADARASKTSGTTAVQVSLDPQGQVTAAVVAQSSGNAGLDAVATQMARDATYTPKYQNCKAVAGSYTFTVKFVAW